MHKVENAVPLPTDPDARKNAKSICARAKVILKSYPNRDSMKQQYKKQMDHFLKKNAASADYLKEICLRMQGELTIVVFDTAEEPDESLGPGAAAGYGHGVGTQV